MCGGVWGLVCDKSTHYYFSELIRLRKGEVSLSPSPVDGRSVKLRILGEASLEKNIKYQYELLRVMEEMSWGDKG